VNGARARQWADRMGPFAAVHEPGGGPQRRLTEGRAYIRHHLFRYRERVIDLDAEIADGALDLRVAEQELPSTQVAGAPVDQSCFRSFQRMMLPIHSGHEAGELACRHALLRSSRLRRSLSVGYCHDLKPHRCSYFLVLGRRSDPNVPC